MRREAVPNGDTAELEGGQTGLAFNRWTIVERARVSVPEIRIRARSEKRGRNEYQKLKRTALPSKQYGKSQHIL